MTFDDALTPQRRRRPEIDPRWLAGRPDAVLVASRIAPVTRHIGLIPVATVTHTEPFHVSKAIATLDFVSHGRAGWQVAGQRHRHEAALFGRRDVAESATCSTRRPTPSRWSRRLWDSWEDDAVIRDVATGRYVDRDKLHYIDFVGQALLRQGAVDHPASAAGPARRRRAGACAAVYEFAARSADLVFITPHGRRLAAAILGEVAQAGGGDLKVYADVLVSFCGDADFRSDALVFDGSPRNWSISWCGWQQLGIDGFRLRPAVNATDLPVIVDEVVPLLQRSRPVPHRLPRRRDAADRLGLPVADNRYSRVEPS